jgi:GTP-binding protein
LGHKFLRHVTRTDLLIHLVDASNIDENDPLAPWRNINRELALFDPELGNKPQVVVANKIDLPEGRAKAELVGRNLPQGSRPLWTISAATTEGVAALVQYIGTKLEAIKQQNETACESAGP